VDACGGRRPGGWARHGALGLARLLASRLTNDLHVGASERIALWLCVTGLIAVFLTGYTGCFVFDLIWPSFHYTPDPTGKNAWLLAQALSIAVYFLGAILMFNAVRRTLGAIARIPTPVSRAVL
jgi:hypothetical protein